MITGKCQATCQNLWPVRYGQKYIPYKDKTKILGVKFTSNHKFNKHIDDKIRIAKVANAKLYRFLTLLL